MIGAISELIKSKEGKRAAVIIGAAVAIMTGLHYYNQIKLTRMKIRELEAKQTVSQLQAEIDKKKIELKKRS